MATTTTNFGWDIPQSTDLVKDGATAIAALGQDIDTALVDLKGGTTGQVLAKATNTDLDFTWVAQDDSNAIQNAIVDAKGDIIAATAADTPARLAVGANDTVLTADSSTATGLKWATPASGGMTLLSTTTLSGSSTSISSINQGYQRLYIEVFKVNPPDNVDFYVKPNNSSTIAYAMGMYNYGGTVSTEPVATNGSMSFGYLEGSDTNNAWGLTIDNYASTAAYKTYCLSGYFKHGSNVDTGVVRGGGIKTDSAISSLVFEVSSGSFSGGTVKIWGVK